jgi:serine/threonine protein kinase/class 3 adenylate cyclase
MKPKESKIEELLQARAQIDEQLRRHKVLITVLFTDIVGSTGYFDRFGDTAGLAMVHTHSQLAAEEVRKHGGTMTKTIGDAIMAHFSDPKSAVRAAAKLQRNLQEFNGALTETKRVKLRIGIHTGMGFTRGTDVYGDVVNLAARITKCSGAGQILVSRAVHEAIASDAEIQCRWFDRCTIDGRPEKEEVFEVAWERVKTARDTVADRAQPASAALATVASRAESRMALDATAAIFPKRYEVLGAIGAGGMGIVYKAKDRETNELLALKVLRPEVACDPVVQANFKGELRMARKITHKNVCRIYDLNRSDDIVFASMEYVEGEDLQSLLQRDGKFAAARRLEIINQICDGLREAHAQGVVHCDLKPANVMVDHKGCVKIMDFGIARLMEADGRQTGTIVGTPAYMSPEQAAGVPVDARTDIYALGLIFYEMVTGKRTFCGDTPVALALKHMRETPQPLHEQEPSVSRHVEAAILKCLEKDPANRFQSVSELQAALQIEAEDAAADVEAPCYALALKSAVAVAASTDVDPSYQLVLHQLPTRVRRLASSIAICARSWKSAVEKRIERGANNLIERCSFSGQPASRQLLLSGCGVLVLTGFSLACVAVRFRELTTSSHAATLDAHLAGSHSSERNSAAFASIPAVSTVLTARVHDDENVRKSLEAADDERMNKADGESGTRNEKAIAHIAKKPVRTGRFALDPAAARSIASVSLAVSPASKIMPYASLPVPKSAAGAQLDSSNRADELAGDDAKIDADGLAALGDTTAPGTSLEVGNFKELSWAQRAADSLEAQGFHVSILHKGHLWANSYHVVVGPYSNAQGAAAARVKLESQGLKVRITK